jgi:AcrR family transcriptional regulator
MSAAPSGSRREARDEPRHEPRRRTGRRTGRRPGTSGTRETILEAARTAFGERGYDGATVREVAERAGVDAALLYHYFGSKQQLFVAAMELPAGWPEAMATIAGSPREQVGRRLARQMIGLWDDPTVGPQLLALVRSAVSDPLAAEMVRGLLTQGPLSAAARATGRPDGELRALLAGSHVVGLMLLRHILRVEPVASADGDTLARLIGPALQHYLAEDLIAG